MLTHPLLRSRLGAVPSVTGAGARSMFRHWMGGVCASPAAAAAPGMRSMFRHWMGGTCAVASTDDDFLGLLTLLCCITPTLLDHSRLRAQPQPLNLN